MKSKHTDAVRKNLLNLVYTHVCYTYPSVSFHDVEAVHGMCGYNVEPGLVLYIQNLIRAWEHMLFTAETSSTYAPMTINELCLYNRICMANISADNGVIQEDESNVGSSNMVSNIVFNSIFRTEFQSVEERAIGLYCDILKANLFAHGNECVARLITNCYLLLNKVGYFDIKEDIIPSVVNLTTDMLNSGSTENLRSYLSDITIYRG